MKVLVVEDDFASRELLRIAITKDGYECFVAEDGENGLNSFNVNNPDVVISDVRMPKMDGISLLEKLRKISKDCIIIIVTGHGNEELALQALQLGANNYIKKPIDLRDLKAQLLRYKNFIESKALESNIADFVVERDIELVIDSEISLAPSTAKYLMQKTDTSFTETEKLGMELGLSELITNAIEHGNLNISFEEKNFALNNNTLQDLYDSRSNQEELRNRKVKISFNKNDLNCEWIIEDEGNGFNYQSYPIHIGNTLQNELHGRGIFISRMQFDEFEYIGKGNIVKVKKYIK